MEDLRRAQQRFGRDAAPIETDAAEIFAFDDSDFEAELCGSDRGDVAAGTRANDQNIEGTIGHGISIRN